MKPLSKAERAEMLALYKSGKSSGWLSRKFGVVDSYPRLLAHERGFRREYPSKAPAKRQRFREYQDTGVLQWLADRQASTT